MEPDASRIEPAYAFSSLKDKLEFPVAGRLLTGWNEDDGTGFPLKGMLFETDPGALVTTPADGWVVYAGPFRSYGQLLILNVGENYDLVLAGMNRIDAAIGQFVVAGEPVGRMKSRRLASAGALALASGSPTLYIEFRKDGEPIDPAPWWADNPSKRVSNDS
jgi:septal ring factor EnvC (AmiA/AmiB activator)